MSDFLTTLRAAPLLADGAMGSLLFERTGRLSEANHVYESFNLDRPELIEEIHLAYLAAGARCLKTNTFGANRHALQLYGLEHRVAAINRAGIQIACNAIARFQLAEKVFVLASIGPSDTDAYREQLEGLLDAKPDALLLETFHSLADLERALDFVQSLPNLPPLIAELTAPDAPLDFIARMQQRRVPVAGVNCCAPWDADAFVEAVKDAPAVRDGSVLLAAMPNGGGFQRIGNRFMSYVNPEYVGRLALGKQRAAALEAEAKKFDQDSMDFEGAKQKAVEELGHKEAELLKPIETLMKTKIDGLAKEHGYSLVLNKQVAIFAVDALDITAEVIKRCDTP